MIDKSKMYKSRKKKAIKILDGFKKKESTDIERKIRNYLDSIGVFYIEQYGIKHRLKNGEEVYRVYDFLVEGTNSDNNFYKFLIECDGDYWHCRDYVEGKQAKSKLTKLQKENLKNDKLKNKIAKEKGIPLLRFFERDIKWDFENKVALTIQNEINYKFES